jgi:hypothetical protein
VVCDADSGHAPFAYHQNFFLRALKELHVGFLPAERLTCRGAAVAPLRVPANRLFE